MMRPGIRIALCAFGIALSPVIVACGSTRAVSVTTPSSAGTGVAAPVPDATTLVHDARSAYRSAKSAHVHATINEDGVAQTIDIRGTMDGTNQELSVKDPSSGNATLRTVDDQYYVRGDQDFWESATTSNSATAALLAGKWVLAPHGMESGSSVSELTIRALLDEMLGAGTLSDSELTQMKTSRATEHGTPLFVATGADSHHDINTVKMLADASNKVAEVSDKSGDGSEATATFDGWDHQSHVDVPKGYVTFPSPGWGPTRPTAPTV